MITGVNIGDFGRDTGEAFLDLLKALDDVEGIERYRISSIEPNLITDEALRWIAEESRAFMPHFHIPLQSGSDAVLRLMNRRYDTALFHHRIETIATLMPDAFIGIDIIAGARGETEEEWQRSLDFTASLPVSRCHVFPYSERPGTKALGIDHIVSQEEKHRRVAMLTSLSESKLAGFHRRFEGATRPVLWENSADGRLMHGHTDNYIRVEAPLREELLNRVTPARLLQADASDPETMKAQAL